VCLRYVSEDCGVFEDCVGYYETASTNAVTVLRTVKHVIYYRVYPCLTVGGQCYDGAINMSGHPAQSRCSGSDP